MLHRRVKQKLAHVGLPYLITNKTRASRYSTMVANTSHREGGPLFYFGNYENELRFFILRSIIGHATCSELINKGDLKRVLKRGLKTILQL